MSDYEYQRLRELGFHAQAEEYRRMSGTPMRQEKPAKVCGGKRKKLKAHPITIMHALAKDKGVAIKPGDKMPEIVQRLKGCGKRPSRKKARQWLLQQAAVQPNRFEAAPKPVARKSKKAAKPKRGANSASFLRSAEWARLRYDAIKKYGARCRACGATPETGAIMHVDHIKPRAKFPELALDINNLQVLCASCNWGKGNRDQTDWR
jgi:hypothetical protein